jgi:monoamine oxidase
VLEARDRVGGRVWSAPLPGGTVVERGAEFVLPGYEALTRVAGRLGLALREKGTLYGDREPRDGAPVAREDVAAAVASLRPAGGSLADALAALAPPLREAVGARLAVSTAYELDDQPAAILADGAAGFGDFPSHSVVGGNDAIAHALAAPLDVRLGEKVEMVEWWEDGVRVDGLDADVAVLAAPATATLAIRFEPPLPAWKHRALAGVRYGAAAKLFLPLAEPVAPSATLSVRGRFWTWTETGVAAASSFAGTPEALERLAVADGPARFAEEVRRLRPDLPFTSEEPELATWPEGAYSARTISSPMDDEALARPLGPLAFAGEHTAGPWHGLMEGALRSGARAAGDLLARYSSVSSR